MLEAVAGVAELTASTCAGQTILHFLAKWLSDTARSELLEVAGRLLRQAQAAGASIDAACSDGAGSQRGWTPLHTAAASCSPFGRLLVEDGADIK